MLKKNKNTLINQLLILILFLFLLFPINSYAIKQKKAFDRGLIVLAPASMTHALHEILQKFSRKMNISVSASYDSTSELTQIIEDGDAANIFISEDKVAIKDLQQKGLLNVFSIKEIATDELVLVVPKNSFLLKKISKFENNLDKINFIVKSSLIAISDPELDAIGRLAKQSFSNLNLWQEIEKKLIKTNNSRASLYLTTNANTPSIVYLSEAKNNSEVRIISKLPSSSYDKISYQIAIVADISSATTMNDSEDFIEFMSKPNVKKVLIKNGFQTTKQKKD
ncbi:MAG: molybdate ABC transporter substrate-binding protein [Rickettsiales bacterium]|nr:molybdate ABC transporter substrate-binding protein [Rickettsiales bacterium]